MHSNLISVELHFQQDVQGAMVNLSCLEDRQILLCSPAPDGTLHKNFSSTSQSVPQLSFPTADVDTLSQQAGKIFKLELYVGHQENPILPPKHVALGPHVLLSSELLLHLHTHPKQSVRFELMAGLVVQLRSQRTGSTTSTEQTSLLDTLLDKVCVASKQLRTQQTVSATAGNNTLAQKCSRYNTLLDAHFKASNEFLQQLKIVDDQQNRPAMFPIASNDLVVTLPETCNAAVIDAETTPIFWTTSNMDNVISENYSLNKQLHLHEAKKLVWSLYAMAANTITSEPVASSGFPETFDTRLRASISQLLSDQQSMYGFDKQVAVCMGIQMKSKKNMKIGITLQEQDDGESWNGGVKRNCEQPEQKDLQHMLTSLQETLQQTAQSKYNAAYESLSVLQKMCVDAEHKELLTQAGITMASNIYKDDCEDNTFKATHTLNACLEILPTTATEFMTAWKQHHTLSTSEHDALLRAQKLINQKIIDTHKNIMLIVALASNTNATADSDAGHTTKNWSSFDSLQEAHATKINKAMETGAGHCCGYALPSPVKTSSQKVLSIVNRTGAQIAQLMISAPGDYLEYTANVQKCSDNAAATPVNVKLTANVSGAPQPELNKSTTKEVKAVSQAKAASLIVSTLASNSMHSHISTTINQTKSDEEFVQMTLAGALLSGSCSDNKTERQLPTGSGLTLTLTNTHARALWNACKPQSTRCRCPADCHCKDYHSQRVEFGTITQQQFLDVCKRLPGQLAYGGSSAMSSMQAGTKLGLLIMTQTPALQTLTRELFAHASLIPPDRAEIRALVKRDSGLPHILPGQQMRVRVKDTPCCAPWSTIQHKKLVSSVHFMALQAHTWKTMSKSDHVRDNVDPDFLRYMSSATKANSETVLHKLQTLAGTQTDAEKFELVTKEPLLLQLARAYMPFVSKCRDDFFSSAEILFPCNT